ncbi:MAG TPA: hypothetical protein VMU19_04585 [Bryobacteraceae bacterium]|nr:hypothetical protein [Bryobacteraceae bacterium]
MRRILLTIVMMMVIGCFGLIHATVCPALGDATDCNVVFTFNSDGTVSTAFPAGGVTPYDGSDDAMIGVINNSGSTILNVQFSGSGNGGGAFEFDDDGACSYVSPDPCNHVPLGAYVSVWGDNGYWDQGSGVWFTNVNAAEDTGTVWFAGGLANGSTAWWSMESAVGANGYTPAPPTPNVPEPGIITLLCVSLVGTGAWKRWVTR